MAEEKKTTEKAAAKPAPKKVAAKKATPAPKKAAATPVPKKAAPKKTTPVPKKKVAKKKTTAPKASGSGKSVNVYSLGGSVVRQVELPSVFEGDLRPDLIRRAVKSAQANRRQAYGPGKKAGMRHAASQWGKGRGTARVQRMTQGKTAVESPPNVGGRRAHPPKPEKDWTEKINKKERRKALISALIAIADPETVSKRGHRITEEMSMPLVLEDRFEELATEIINDNPEIEDQNFTKETIKILKDLGLGDEIQRAVDGKHIRAGKGTMRGRPYKRPKGILFVVTDKSKIMKCVKNIPGVDITTPNMLNVEMLAPGGDPGRLTVFTESALKTLEVDQ
ncbi:MAG: 50S ribosomal protein L4 [Thermoplasmata archaeon]|nr:50S ribosomal protein L4 [Thermoplasmata archaeon]